MLTSSETNAGRLIAAYHSDVPTYPMEETMGLLNVRSTLIHQFATTTITVKSVEQIRKNPVQGLSGESENLVNAWMNLPDCGVCVIEHRKKSGKVLYETNMYHIDESTTELVIQPEKNESVNEEVNTVSDPTTANLLFNLSLTEEQKKAKDEVILPYVKIQDQYEEKGSPTAGGGTIFYEPDDADDFDEEDPDEDLDI
ncbi:16397_t:CDS:2 [Acaulospora morrowiae]|uniref:Elongator complex protein 5 n=1 Tax=Acaulospora morrowiae TaxID=94023 RepID=A0A9N8V484_9GLOM|nr:16397_t:CDS:2 [Acaulospora morrowiae]